MKTTNPTICPRCNVAVRFYDGCLGYESYQCPVCHWDINDPPPVAVPSPSQERRGGVKAWLRKILVWLGLIRTYRQVGGYHLAWAERK